MSAKHNKSLIDDLIGIKSQLGADSNTSYEILQQRDRRIGIGISHLKPTPLKQVQAWLHEVQKAGAMNFESSFSNVKTVISSILIIAGLLTGISAALTLFYYTGAQPINVINVLAVGVGLQLVLLLIFFLALISRSTWLSNILSSFNAGRWAARLAYLVPSLKSSLNTLLDSHNDAFDEQIIKWQTVYWSQQFALAFNIALLLCCIYLVTFSDLAFGWSTTLAFDSHVVKKITDALSLPWKTFMPQAVPQLELIDATRFYRLKTITLGNQDTGLLNQAQLAGNWWRFLFLCLLVYGFIPRLLTYLYTKLKLNHSIKQSIMGLPGLHLLLDRMNTPAVATSAETPELPNDLNQIHSANQITALSGRNTFIMHWGQPAINLNDLTNWLHNATGATVLDVRTVASNINEDLIGLNALPKIKGTEVLTILVKAWEPPTLELTDWLAELRVHYGNPVLIALVPYDITPESKVQDASLIDSNTWQDFLRRHDAQHIEFHGARA